ncbi:UDP-N-acetylmuramate--L-alanine ligase [Pseudomarimonas arenosa]|uniref:UDP-N-acetylmuramate--L-alanine ligase n=1 Tax=Pseudomarimonas arenosa TaxID=2774145 RepID=A0AAW3ZLA1_9GAMM|nr:UDP-N-acetylmuramate--L-alanine ligase [Pseudomarimonas arenosa]MBD8525457.1 UDP-N-acetylmuramate--L-alanine ligase [Pseudomarimonas arenosa]
MKRLQHSGDLATLFRRVHFIGIGGAGMSGIAEVLCTLGYTVSGSDLGESAVVQRLRKAGARVEIGHAAGHVQDVDVVVVSSAIKRDNPEWVEARKRRIPVVPRAEMLAELMRFRRGIAIAGTHGKTTTTSLVASVLSEGGLDPTFVIGGQLLAAGTHARLGAGEWLVAEADESDGSFLRLTPLVAVVTNIDADHLENYDNDFGRVQQAFSEFLHRLPFYGLAVLCIDDPWVAKLAEEMPRHLITYGLGDQAEVRAQNLRQSGPVTAFDLCLPDEPKQHIELNLPGKHNVLNALAAAAIGWQLGVPATAIAKALASFQGVGRRFNVLGELAVEGGHALLVDDYGHHPRELEAVFSAARDGWPERRLVVAFQPHRYSRTRDLLDDFAAVLSQADSVLLSEVYAAGEAPIAGADAKALARAIRSRGRVEPVVVGQCQEFNDVLPNVLQDGDLLIVLGAGDIGRYAQQLIADGLNAAAAGAAP